ncbi:chemotaxis protein CheW [Hydrogenophaga pseudoflava]|uniref:chemotaxis protein CheW n=1 Tax=Hydrogenophaga pseudoflava TaxID=47421 RepID=UPI0027E40CA7|nr:chemotaxis protein CheW [Hydrogenophaga pseudoflava]MDQ7744918.1 chemotaxis protein CheW [Hydrogenophaga pseudoflava]
MANRQSLKDLQVRLAERLTAARTEGASLSWLALEAGGGRFLVPLVQSGEIFPWASLQTVPYTKRWYAGVASLRGGLHGVIDLALLSGRLAASSATRTADRVTSESRLVSLHSALGVNAVLWIDRLLGLRNPSMFASVVERDPQAPAWYARRFTDKDGREWQELNLQALSHDPEFLAIAA